MIVGLALLAFGGVPYVLWGIFFRTTLGLHATWLVNSATHKWGSRRFDTRDDSTNNWWVALLTFGEGWHNNHHAHPTSARHGLAWYEIDFNWMGIRTLQALGLAWDLKLPASLARSGRGVTGGWFTCDPNPSPFDRAGLSVAMSSPNHQVPLGNCMGLGLALLNLGRW